MSDLFGGIDGVGSKPPIELHRRALLCVNRQSQPATDGELDARLFECAHQNAELLCQAQHGSST